MPVSLHLSLLPLLPFTLLPFQHPPPVSCDAAASAAGGARRGADAEQRDGAGRTAGGRAWAECAGEAGAASGWGTPAPDSGSAPSSEHRVHSRPAGGPRRVGLG